MPIVYKCARKPDIAAKWASGNQNTAKSDSFSTTANGKKAHKGANSFRLNSEENPWTEVDANNKVESGGRAMRGKVRPYRENDRCWRCRKQPWSDLSHPFPVQMKSKT